MSLRTTLYLIILFLGIYGKAQVKDDFSDGNFISDPEWTGDVDHFQAAAGALNTAGPEASAEIYLSTPTTLSDYAVWEFYLRIDGSAPSGSNQAKIYLMVDGADLTAVAAGYYLEIGQTGDDYLNFYRSDGTLLVSGTSVFDGQVSLKVTRSPAGEWQLWADPTGGSDFGFEAQVIDNTYSTTTHFGWKVKHTKTRRESFFLDDIVADQLRVDSIEVLSATSLSLDLNQFVRSEDAENSAYYSIAGIDVVDVQRDASDSSKVQLTLDENTPLMSGTYDLVVGSLLTKNEADSVGFSYLQLVLDTVLTLTATELELQFNEELDQTEAENAANYSIDQGVGTPTLAELDVSDPKRVKLTLDMALDQELEYSLTCFEIPNRSGNSSYSGSKDFRFVIPLVVDSVAALASDSLLVVFNKELEQVTALDVSNYKLSGLEAPDAVELRPDGKSVLLQFGNSFSDTTYTLNISNVKDTSGNELDGVRDKTFSYLSLAITALNYIGENQLRLTFNQLVDSSSAKVTSNYVLTEVGTPIAVVLDSNAVSLTWEQLYNADYQLSVLGVGNYAENSRPDSLSASVAVRKATAYRSLIITEIMADPTPVVGLPDAEYVELYNAQDYAINTEDFQLNGKSLGSYQLEPKAYLLLTDRSDSAAFGLSNSLGIPGFDALTNGGETVRLTDQYGATIDSVNYTDDWYGISEKSNGGYALELIDPLQPCSGVQNWTASTHPSGGTPGAENTVFDDQDFKGPVLHDLEILGGDTVLVYFDEPIDDSTIELSDFSMEHQAFGAFHPVDLSTFRLVLTEPLASREYYTLQVAAVADCRGNVASNLEYAFYHDIAAPMLVTVYPVAQDVLAVVFDEPLEESSAEQEHNFVLSGYEVTQAVLQDTATHRVHLEIEPSLSFGTSHTLQTTDLKDTLNNSSGKQERLFEFSTAIDTWSLSSANVMSLSFDQEIDSTRSLNTQNFQLADGCYPQSIGLNGKAGVVLGFENSFTANKPLRLYVRSIFNTANELLSTPAVDFIYDTRSPDLDSIKVADERTIVLYWDEALDTIRAKATSRYALDGNEPAVVEAKTSQQFLLTFDSSFAIEQDLVLIVSAQKDLAGNRSTSKRRTIVYDPQPPNITSTEYRGPEGVLVNFHEQLSLESIFASSFLLDGVEAGSVHALGPDSTGIRLSFPGLDFSSTSDLHCEGIADIRGNVSEQLNAVVDSYSPGFVKVIAQSDSVVDLHTSHEMKPGITSLISSSLVFDSIVAISPYESRVFLANSLNDGDHILFASSEAVATHGPVLQDSISFYFNTYLKTYELKDAWTISIQFETSFESISENTFSTTGPALAFVQLDGGDPSILQLLYSDSLPANEPIQISWRGLFDRYGRRLPDSRINILRDTNPPGIDTVLAKHKSQIVLRFDEAVDAVSAVAKSHYMINATQPLKVRVESDREVVLDMSSLELEVDKEYVLLIDGVSDLAGNYLLQDKLEFTYAPPSLPTFQQLLITEIMADPSPSVGLPEVEYLEIYNAGDQSINLGVLLLTDEQDTVALPDYELSAGAYAVLVDNGEVGQFAADHELGISNLSLSNDGEQLALLTLFDQVVDEVAYTADWYGENKANGGYSLERIAFDGTCPTAFNWSASTDSAGGTPGGQNALFREGSDGSQPQLIATALTEQKVVLEFSEPMDSSSLLDATVDFDLMISGRMLDEEALQLSLLLSEQPIPGNAYELVLKGAQDCTGTALDSTFLKVYIGKTPQPGELLITEVMSDPDPVVGLPNAEFVELFNSSEYYLALKDILLIDERDTARLPDYALAPKSYIALCAESSAQELGVFGKAMGVKGFPSLANNGETLRLAVGGETLDKVIYSSDWYQDPAHYDGGYSLELINPQGSCKGAANWTGSIAAVGGTPGGQNSVFNDGPDDDTPLVMVFEALDASTLRFVFNESMDSLSLQRATIEGVVVDSYRVSGYYHDTLEAHLFVPVPRDQMVSITLSGPQDCSGNGFEMRSFTFGLGAQPVFGELVVSEIMSDPEPVVGQPVSEYLELHNTSDKLLSLSGLWLFVDTDTINLPAVTIPAGGFHLLVPANVVGRFEQPNVSGVSGWKSLKNTGDYLAIVGDELIYQVSYTNEWYGDENKREGGYSLEMIDPTNVCAGANNWKASTHPTGGTPTAENSVSGNLPDNFGPDLLDIQLLSARQLQCVFSEPLELDAERNMVVNLQPNISVMRKEVNRERTRLTITLADSLEQNKTYLVQVFGARDCLGNTQSPQERVVIRPGEAIEGQVILSELLFDPRKEGVDFVELYNTADTYVDIYGWILERETTSGIEQTKITTHYIMGPKAYLALTEDTLVLKTQYPQGVHKKLLQTNLPSLPNEAGNIRVIAADGKRQDAFAYDSDMHLKLLDEVDGVSLERLAFDAPTQDANNWTSAASAMGFATPGYANSQQHGEEVVSGTIAVSPKVFVPASTNPAFASFTTITYQLTEPGQFANITIYDQSGKVAYQLARGVSLSREGFVRWDGTDDGGQQVPMGYYIVLFELYDGLGGQEYLRETVVVGQ